jgi:hypothetical protein
MKFRKKAGREVALVLGQETGRQTEGKEEV